MGPGDLVSLVDLTFDASTLGEFLPCRGRADGAQYSRTVQRTSEYLGSDEPTWLATQSAFESRTCGTHVLVAGRHASFAEGYVCP